MKKISEKQKKGGIWGIVIGIILIVVGLVIYLWKEPGIGSWALLEFFVYLFSGIVIIIISLVYNFLKAKGKK